MADELRVLVGRLKAIVTEIEAVMGAPKPMNREEYLAADENTREAHDKKKMGMQEENEDAEGA
jgi:hypothetical protein